MHGLVTIYDRQGLDTHVAKVSYTTLYTTLYRDTLLTFLTHLAPRALPSAVRVSRRGDAEALHYTGVSVRHPTSWDVPLDAIPRALADLSRVLRNDRDRRDDLCPGRRLLRPASRCGAKRAGEVLADDPTDFRRGERGEDQPRRGETRECVQESSRDEIYAKMI